MSKVLEKDRRRKSESAGPETARSEPEITLAFGSLVGEVDPSKYPLRDIDSEALQMFRARLTPGEEAVYALYWDNTKQAFVCLQTVTAKMIEKIPDLNVQLREYNKKQALELADYKAKRKKANNQISVLKKELAAVQKDVDQREIVYRTALTAYEAKESPFQEYEKEKTSLALVKADAMTLPLVVFIWVIRAVLGVALALSLGLIIGALNQYRPFTPILGVFWFIGCAILFNSGTVVHWLAVKSAEVMEARRYSGANVSPGNKWTWLLVSTILFFSAVDAATLMFGAFRLLKVSGEAITGPVLLLVCFIFIFPYLYMETSYGWSEGERKIKELKSEVLIENEERVANITLDSLGTEKAELERPRLEFEQAKAEVAEIEVKIRQVDSEPVMPEGRSPICYGPGIYPSDAQWANATWSSELMAPPLNEELNIARRKFLDMYAEALACEEDLIRKVLIRRGNGQKRSALPSDRHGGFFARWRSR